jgi:glycosyltransferase involved in cell wall biosynthesis
VLTIGRIHPQKNLEGLIDAAALAIQQMPMRLMIVGSGDAGRVAS